MNTLISNFSILFRVVAIVFIASSTFTICAQQQTSEPGSTEREQGIQLYRQKQYTESARLLKTAVSLNKSDEQGWYYLGLSLTQQAKEMKNASQAFETAIKLRPKFAAARAGLSYTLLKREKFSEALREAEAALAIEPGIANAHYIISVIRLNHDEYEEAVKEAREAVRLNPNLAPAYLALSEAIVGIYGRQFLNLPRTSRPAKPLSPAEHEEARKKLKARQAPLKEAAESLETYLRLNPADPSAELWHRQLENLRVFAYADDPSHGDAIMYGFEVTTKAKVLQKPAPDFTDAARSARISGKVILQAVLAADGTVRNILILKGLPHGLTESAILAARQIKFTPALVDGKPVSMFVQLEYHFHS